MLAVIVRVEEYLLRTAIVDEADNVWFRDIVGVARIVLRQAASRREPRTEDSCRR